MDFPIWLADKHFFFFKENSGLQVGLTTATSPCVELNQIHVEQ